MVIPKATVVSVFEGILSTIFSLELMSLVSGMFQSLPLFPCRNCALNKLPSTDRNLGFSSTPFGKRPETLGRFRIHVVKFTTHYRTLRCIFFYWVPRGNPHQTGCWLYESGVVSRDLKWSSYPSRFQPFGSVDRLEIQQQQQPQHRIQWELPNTLGVWYTHPKTSMATQNPHGWKEIPIANYHLFRIHISFPESRFVGLLVGLINMYIYNMYILYIYIIYIRIYMIDPYKSATKHRLTCSVCVYSN